MRIRDTFWQWGHPEGCFNTEYGNNQVSRMTPMEGCLYLGIQKTFMIPMEHKVNYRQYNQSFETLNEVMWEFQVDYENGILPEQADWLIEEAKLFPNIHGMVLDDFVRDMKYKNIPVESMWALREHLHKHGLQMWMVLYTHEFGKDPAQDAEFQAYIEPFDGITLWNWKEKNYLQIPEKFEIFKQMAKNKRCMMGCYLYNFGENKEATGDAVTWQLELYKKMLFAGEIEGVVLHTNSMADLGFEAYDACRSWMAAHGDEEIPL